MVYTSVEKPFSDFFLCKKTRFSVGNKIALKVLPTVSLLFFVIKTEVHDYILCEICGLRKTFVFPIF